MSQNLDDIFEEMERTRQDTVEKIEQCAKEMNEIDSRASKTSFWVMISSLIMVSAAIVIFGYNLFTNYDLVPVDQQVQGAFADFVAEEYVFDENTFFLNNRAYLKIELPGRASDNLQELSRLLDLFEANANSLITHWESDQEDPNFKNKIGYLHGIWIEYKVRPVDYK